MVEQQPGVVCGDQRVLFGRCVAEIGGTGAVDEGDVGVAFDEAGHHGHAGGFDDLGAGGFELAGLGGDGADAIAFHQYVGGVRRCTGAVPHAAIAEQ